MLINSLNNERVKNWAKLSNKKYRDAEGLFLIEGDHLVTEAIKKGCVKEIIVTEKNVVESSLPIYEVTEAIMKKITNQVSISKICAVCYKLEEKEIFGNTILLDDIQDPGNLGTIIRSAVAFNFNTIILGEACVDLYNDKAIRASEGMMFYVNVIRKNLKEIIPKLKSKDYIVLGTNVTNGVDIKSIQTKKTVALVLGNEGNGIKEEIEKICDKNIYIKTDDACESLNVGVAASILMYEISNKE